MNISSFLRLTAASSALVAAIHVANAQTVWLVQPGTLVVTPSYSAQSFDEFYVGTAKMKLPADLKQTSESARFDYGLTASLALDATIGYTEVKFSPPGASFKRGGRDDAKLGLSYALLRESSELPAVTVRVGAIIAGNYSVPTTLPPINPGDGASGFETSLSAGKALGEGFAVYGEVGYRNRNHGVPDDFFGSVGASKTFDAFTVNLGYRREQSLSGGDIGGTGFGTKFGFPGVKQVQQFGEVGLAYTDGGGRNYQVFAAKSYGNIRNSGRATIFGLSVSLPFKF